MAHECFVPKVFSAAHRLEIARAQEIIDEYAAQGFGVFTLRSLYYRFVARDYIPNTFQSYKRLGEIINAARLAGELDWDVIGDSIRNLDAPPSWDDGEDMMNSAAHWMQKDPWEPTDTRIEVWAEKDAITNFVHPVCRRWRVPFFACRGFTSQSEMHVGGKRIGNYLAEGRKVLILHIGDHDPSGIDMSRDNEARLRMFAEADWSDLFEFRRIALNMDQIERYNPPPNPTKTTDSRARGENGYIARYGYESWELDALSPTALDEIISSHIEPEVDQVVWDEVIREEETEREKLLYVRDNWSEIIAARA